MALKVIYLNERLVQRHSQTLGERRSDKERSEESRATCKGYRRNVFRLDAGTCNSLTHNRHYVYLMGS